MKRTLRRLEGNFKLFIKSFPAAKRNSLLLASDLFSSKYLWSGLKAILWNIGWSDLLFKVSGVCPAVYLDITGRGHETGQQPIPPGTRLSRL